MSVLPCARPLQDGQLRGGEEIQRYVPPAGDCARASNYRVPYSSRIPSTRIPSRSTAPRQGTFESASTEPCIPNRHACHTRCVPLAQCSRTVLGCSRRGRSRTQRGTSAWRSSAVSQRSARSRSPPSYGEPLANSSRTATASDPHPSAPLLRSALYYERTDINLHRRLRPPPPTTRRVC